MMMKFATLIDKEQISLWQKNLQDEDLDEVTKVLEESKVLEVLDMSSNKLAFTNSKFIYAVAKNPTLTVLFLNGNTVGPKGALALSSILKCTQTIRKLSLSNNEILAEGARHLASALLTNKSLTFMDLRNNNIGDEGAL